LHNLWHLPRTKLKTGLVYTLIRASLVSIMKKFDYIRSITTYSSQGT